MGVDIKLGREMFSLAFPSSGMRQALRWRPAFTKVLTTSATIQIGPPYDRRQKMNRLVKDGKREFPLLASDFPRMRV